MAFNNGAKLAMWSFEDKGNYGVANLTYRRKNKDGGFVTYGHKFCNIYDLAYEELKNVTIPEDGHVEIQIANEPYTRTVNNKSFDQNPIEVDARYNKEQGRQEFGIKIFKASIIKSVEKKTQNEEEKPPFNAENTESVAQNVTPVETPSQNGLVGLDFLNIPDGFVGAELPFK